MNDRIPGSSYYNPIWYGKWRIFCAADIESHGYNYEFMHADCDLSDIHDNRFGRGVSIENCLDWIDQIEKTREAYYKMGDNTMSRTAKREMKYREDLHNYKVPQHLHNGLLNYLIYYIPTGGFLTAVLQNDLKLALDRADSASRHGLANVVAFLYEKAPQECWGSPEKVDEWLMQRERT